MKRRCMCDKPDYIVMDFPVGRYPLDLHYNVFGWEGKSNILHWKSATTECSRCGKPLCRDCRIDAYIGNGKRNRIITYGIDVLCYSCMEVI